MMMGALRAGGMSLVSDGVRVADSHNPLGYFEDERVKTLEKENDWLNEHLGRAIKILFHKVEHIPPQLPCRFLFMQRELPAVIASQNKMLNKTDDDIDWVTLYSREVAKTLAHLEKRPHSQLLKLDFRQLLQSPLDSLSSAMGFLKIDLNLEAMARTIRPALSSDGKGLNA